MSLPQVGQGVTVVVPRRDTVPGRVRATGPGWVDVILEQAMRYTPGQRATFLHYVAEDGVVRLPGKATGRFGRDEIMRLAYRGGGQLLRRAESLSAAGRVKVVATLARPGAVPVEAVAVRVSPQGLCIRGMEVVEEREVYGFELFLQHRQPPVAGELVVEHVLDSGDCDVCFTALSSHDKVVLASWCVQHGLRSVA
jgi:hypothetical protein